MQLGYFGKKDDFIYQIWVSYTKKMWGQDTKTKTLKKIFQFYLEIAIYKMLEQGHFGGLL
jgi:hypothetical protein